MATAPKPQPQRVAAAKKTKAQAAKDAQRFVWQPGDLVIKDGAGENRPIEERRSTLPPKR